MLKFAFFTILLLPYFSYAQSLKELNNQKTTFKLPKLTYSTSALAPNIDKTTMEIHHGKHHQGYVEKLNANLTEKENQKTLFELLRNTKNYSTAIRNNAGGHWNHSFFWTILTDNNKKKIIKDTLLKKINADFGSIEKFKEQFESSAQSVFGSGWVWLIINSQNNLQIVTTPNQDNPLMDIATTKGKPILGLDVWEHAYYINYQNKRPEYIKNFWNIVNWEQVAKYHSEKIKL